MDFSTLRTETLRLLFAATYATNFCLAAIYFGKTYLEGLAASIVMFFSLIMLSISLQKPGSFMIYLETSEKEVAFTWVGRLFADTLIILFVASFGLPGKIMAIVTLFFFLVTLGIAKHRPDIFRDLFRAHEQDPSLGESYNVAP
mmetsp:Transcript_9591/g.14383  ORF Transcript_9591/g.14383 Transcript_9591/m.14383 type:complete len:144 (+) Transcript_9591:104-535(+)